MQSGKILVVDDEKDFCFFMKKYLVSKGYRVDIAYDGLQAAEILENERYDAVFFDCNMPELSGMELVSIISKKNPGARKVMISGYEGINEQFAEKLDVDVFLSKPFSLEQLEKMMNEI